MKNEYPFLVELGKEGGNASKYEQHLFCKCGHKQKAKLSVKRMLLKNAENVYEDKYEVDTIKCDICGESFNVLNSLFGIKDSKDVLVEISFDLEESKDAGNDVSVLKRNRKYFFYVREKDSVDHFVVTDRIEMDMVTGELTAFYDSSDMRNGGFSGNLMQSKSNSRDLSGNKETTNSVKKTEVFDLSKPKCLDAFFSFESSVNYKNLENAFNFIESILLRSYDYAQISKEKFVSDFMVSKRIFTEERNGKNVQFILKKNMFGGGSTVKKPLDTGDYVNRLQKFAEISAIFNCYSPISTIYKLKGLDFIHKAFKHSYLAPRRVLIEHKASNPLRIIEVCCKDYFVKNNVLKERGDEMSADEFRLSPVLFKAICEPDDAMVIYRFLRKDIISKSELESILQKFDQDDVIMLMSKLVSGSNHRNVRLDIRHVLHILKSRIFDDHTNDWLNIYYDTINSLRLIVEIIKVKKEEGKTSKNLLKLERISDDKLFEAKSYDKLKVLHDEMSAVYRAMEDEGKDLKYRAMVKVHSKINQKVNLFDFRVIPNLNELSKEGLVMHHCIYTYLNDIASGNYIAVRVKDLISKERATMGLKIVSGRLYLQQLKGYYNSRPTPLLIETSLAYCRQMDIQVESSYLHTNDITPNPSLEKRMKEYLDPKEAWQMRKKASSKN